HAYRRGRSPRPALFSFLSRHTPPPESYTLSLHDALPIFLADHEVVAIQDGITGANKADAHLAHVQYGRDYEADEVVDIRTVVERSEEHTSELQSRENLVCRLLLEKKKTKTQTYS